MEFKEIIYEKKDGVAKISINRPERLNSFTALTIEEMVLAFEDAWVDKTVGVVVLTGVGDRAFCAGGDQKQKDESGEINHPLPDRNSIYGSAQNSRHETSEVFSKFWIHPCLLCLVCQNTSVSSGVSSVVYPPIALPNKSPNAYRCDDCCWSCQPSCRIM